MFLSRLLFFFLSVYGLSAAELSQESKELEDRNELKETQATNVYDGRIEGSAGLKAPVAQGPDKSLTDGRQKRSSNDPNDIEDYVNDILGENELLYAVYDYDGGANDKNLHVIDPKSLAVSPIPDASLDLIHQINQTSY